MSSPEKPSGSVDTPTGAAPAPTEGGVSPAAVLEGQLREANTRMEALDERIRHARADGTGVDAPPTSPGTPPPPEGSQNEGSTSWWVSLFGGVSSTWSTFSKWITEKGKAFGTWFGGLFGLAEDKVEEAAQTIQDAASKAGEEVEEEVKGRLYQLLELLNPTAPFFTFLKGRVPRISSNFGGRDDPMEPGKHQNHGGDDITLAPGDEDIGEPIVAPRALAVAEVGKTGPGGYFIRVENPEIPGVLCTLRHIGGLLWKRGDTVPEGAVIATLDKTGTRVKGAHLHVEIQKDGKLVDPAPYLGIG